MSEKRAYKAFEPAISIEIENRLSAQRRAVECFGRNFKNGRFDVTFPLCGTYNFSSLTGDGLGLASEWFIPVEHLRVLRDDPTYRVLRGIKVAKNHQSKKQSEDERQLVIVGTR